MMNTGDGPKLFPGEARAILRDAVTANIKHRRTGRKTSQFSEERDECVEILTAAGYPANYQDFEHPSDV